MSRIALVALGPGGAELAGRLQARMQGAECHALARRVEAADVLFADTAAHLRALFQEDVAIVGICAAGILVRAIGPLLESKRQEPPVIAVAEDGSAVVPLLGMHRGGNRLAREVSAILGVAPSITTAGDARFGIALDDPPPGYLLIERERAKEVMAAVLAGDALALDGDAPWLVESGVTLKATARRRIVVSPQRSRTAHDGGLTYRPAVLAVGVGCERNTAPDELHSLVATTLAEADLDPAAIAGFFSHEVKSDEPAVHALGEIYEASCRFLSAAELEAETPRLATPSEVVFREVGAHGVAEAAALAAAGPHGRLIVPKRKSARATCAIALAPHVIDVDRIGRPRGELLVVGTGPGAHNDLTGAARTKLARAEALVGYGLYLDLLGPLARGKRRHDFPLGQETERVDFALDLAAEGRVVALVSSGDPGIYAMASLVFERLEARGEPRLRRIGIQVVPGVSAAQAAAARAGAPLGHDFCFISLSDLLTPWAAIEARLEAAAAGDFVVALYNPVSLRRTWQLGRAREILLGARPPETPVVIARALGRSDERVTLTTLAALDPASVDMLTVVLVGSTATRRFGDRVYTPRGYAGKPKDIAS